MAPRPASLNMELSPQQKEALAAVKAWVQATDRMPVFRLFGYAGTGKTTIAKEATSLVGGRVMYGAYTGKAALLLQNKGCFGAQTVHKMIYVPDAVDREHVRQLERALEDELAKGDEADKDAVAELEEEIEVEKAKAKRPRFTINPKSDVKGASLVVLDEVSMVGQKMAEDLLSFGVPVLALGDPAQLPPVGSGGYFTARRADFLLTEIHRQAAGSPVLSLATRVREGERLSPCELGDSRVVGKGVLKIADVAAHDQVIVGTNKAKRDLNASIRHHLGRTGPMPLPGDKLVCLRNDYDNGMLNGSQWTVVASQPGCSDSWLLDLASEEMGTRSVSAWRHHFEGREQEIKPWDITEHNAFDYGYAMTCHKAQGSQWGSVLVIDESYAFRGDARRWLYTALTRASNRVTVVQK